MHDELEQIESCDEKSKSQIKREFAELQGLGEKLIALKPAQIHKFPFSQNMLDALEEYTRIKNRTAQQRHIRRIGKLLADEDVANIRHILERLDSNHPEKRRRQEFIEQWQKRLIAEGDNALNELAEFCPDLDRHYLRQIVRAAQKEKATGKNPSAAKKILTYIKSIDCTSGLD